MLHFYLGIFQNYLVFIPAIEYIKYFTLLLEFIRRNLMECQKKVLKISDGKNTIQNKCLG